MNVEHSTSERMRRYVLATAAYNEEAHIERTILSVLSQTRLPEKWVIVSDGSTDRTDEIVTRYSEKFGFIELLRLDERHTHNFASKVYALNNGFALSKQVSIYDFIGNLDADLSFDPNYFEELLGRFECNPLLGVGGGSICEWDGNAYRARSLNSVSDVAGAVQLFRRECHQAVGDFLPLSCGGEDWCAQVMARMEGWQVQSFPDIKVRHHRGSGTTAGLIRYCFRQGVMDFSLGSLPVYELARLAKRLGRKPIILGAFARFCGFVWSHFSVKERMVSRKFIEFLRNEEITKLTRFVLNRSGRRSSPEIEPIRNRGDQCARIAHD